MLALDDSRSGKRVCFHRDMRTVRKVDSCLGKATVAELWQLTSC